jgi:NAD-dependent deacetylase
VLLCAHELAALAERVRLARRVLVLTGAGMSAESGVPTFREAQTGLWARFAPEDLATPEAFAATPERVMDWYRWRRGLVAAAEPNAGHRALARWQRARDGTGVVTQNVDGLHQRAGSTGVVELHGRLSHLRCERCSEPLAWPDEDAGGLLEHAGCGGRLRPDIVWFGEAVPDGAWQAAMAAARAADVVIVVGTWGVGRPAAALPDIARAAGAYAIEVNPQRTPLSAACDSVIAGTAAEILPVLLAT